MPFSYSKDETPIQSFFEVAVLDYFLLRSQSSITWYYQMILVNVKKMQSIYSAL